MRRKIEIWNSDCQTKDIFEIFNLVFDITNRSNSVLLLSVMTGHVYTIVLDRRNYHETCFALHEPYQMLYPLWSGQNHLRCNQWPFNHWNRDFDVEQAWNKCVHFKFSFLYSDCLTVWLSEIIWKCQTEKNSSLSFIGIHDLVYAWWGFRH